MFDPFFEVKLDPHASSPDPERAIWNAQHVCVAEGRDSPTPSDPGASVVKHQLEGGRGHYSVAAFAFAKVDCFGFPHDAIVQARTHHTSGTDVRFLVQSNRYTGDRFVAVARQQLDPRQVFYTRPAGVYASRAGRYEKSEASVGAFYRHCARCCEEYAEAIAAGLPSEEARSLLPQGIRQDFTIASTLKGFWHLLDQRAKKDAQLEIQVLAQSIQSRLREWAPTLSRWYEENRWGKARLAP